MSSMKPLLTPDQVRQALSDRVLSVVAERTGLHKSTIYRLADGERPSLETLEALSEYLQRPIAGTVEVVDNG